MRMKGFRILTACLLALHLISCGKKEAPVPPRIVPVRGEAAVKMDVPLQVRAIGRAEALTTVAVRSQVSGTIASAHFREGQDVKKGDLLFKLDPLPFETTLRQAEANLARDQAQLRNARAEADQNDDLARQGFISKLSYERLKTQVDALEAVVRADEAAVGNARILLGYTTITSPIDGKTGDILIQAGNVVKANDLPLVLIHTMSPIAVTFSVPEKELATVRTYAARGPVKVVARPDQGTAEGGEGLLTFIDNQVNTATGTVLLKATLPNKDRSLWPGQFVNVVMTLTTEPGRIVVPSEAVQAGQQGAIVYVVRPDMTVEVRTVQPVRRIGRWTVIEKDVEPGETVVTDGQIRLTPGARVEVKTEDRNQKTDARSQKSE